MSEPYDFKVDDLPDHIYEPLSFFSVITKDHGFLNEIREAEELSYYTSQCSDVLKLLLEIESSPATFFALKAIQGNNSIEWSSKDSERLELRLNEYSYSHHHYVGRYLRFIKEIAPKGSVEYGTTFSASAKRSQEKYTKDLEAVVASLFSDAKVTLVIDSSLEELAASTCRNWNRINGQVKTCEILSFTDFTPFTADEVTEENLEEFYEYLSLLHLNAYPFFENSHVSATTSYLHSIEGGTKAAPAQLYLISLSGASPLLFSKLIQKEQCLSAQATTKKRSVLSYNNEEHLYTWKVSRS